MFRGELGELLIVGAGRGQHPLLRSRVICLSEENVDLKACFLAFFRFETHQTLGTASRVVECLRMKKRNVKTTAESEFQRVIIDIGRRKRESNENQLKNKLKQTVGINLRPPTLERELLISEEKRQRTYQLPPNRASNRHAASQSSRDD